MADAEKIGLFGGTFNPIHIGHVRAAREVAKRLSLARVVFIPSAVPPHKELQDNTSAEHRLAMARLATAGDPLFRVSDIEIARGGESFTLHTLQAMKRDAPGARFTFILGADAYREIRTWHRVEDVLPLADWAVIARPGFRLDSLAAPLGNLAGKFRAENDHALACDDPPTRILFLPIPETNVSSSAVREAVRSGRSLAGMVEDAVADYIARHGLYRTK